MHCTVHLQANFISMYFSLFFSRPVFTYSISVFRYFYGIVTPQSFQAVPAYWMVAACIKEEEEAWQKMQSVVCLVGLVGWFDLFNAKLSLKRYW